MNSYLLHESATAALRRRLSCMHANQLHRAQKALSLYGHDCTPGVCAPKVRCAGFLQRRVEKLTVNHLAAVTRASRYFYSRAATAAAVRCGSSNKASSSRAENGDALSAVTPPSFPSVRVTDSSSHWLPSLARATIRQDISFCRLSDAAKGNCSSADVQTVKQKALATVRREGWSVPGVAVVLFSAQWSEPSRVLQQWLSVRLSALLPFRNSEDKGENVVEFVAVGSEEAPVMLRVFGVASLPHCLLMANGHVVCELPAGASSARHEAFIAAVSAAASTAPQHMEQAVPASSLLLAVATKTHRPYPQLSPRMRLLDRLLFAVRRRSPRDLNEIETLLHKLKEDLLVSADTSEHNKQSPPPRRTFGMKNLRGNSALQPSLGSDSNDRHQAATHAGYLLDSDERASQLTALATVALFDVPEVHTPDLQGLHELLSWAMQKRRGSAKRSGEAPPVRAGLRGTLEKIIQREEPQWAPDDCPIIRCLPLYNQCLLNKSLFAKAQGAQPLRLPQNPSATPTIATDAGAETPRTTTAEAINASLSEECLKVELWRLAEWLARTSRCLSARLFLDTAEASGLELAMTSHVDWLKDAAQCNYMQVNAMGCKEKTARVSTRSAASQDKLQQPRALHDKKGTEVRGVHPFNAWFEPRSPSPGRTLLACMYAALGPDDRKVQHTIARFDVAVNAHQFYPRKFPHTKARRGGKPRMMRGMSGRWFWLGPYWKPPWAPRRKSLTEDWHLTNVAA